MDLSMIIGLLAGAFLVFFGIVFDGDSGSFAMSAIRNFIDYPSMAITFGGCIMVTFMSFPVSYFRNIPKHFRIILRKTPFKTEELIEKIVSFAQEARRSGLMSLEAKAEQEADPFLKNSLFLIVDAIDAEKVKSILENELDELENRHAHGWEFYEKFAGYAPAFGMIGTLIGLINMLANMDMDAAGGVTKMAQGMSVALVTTFYGSMFANMILLPMGHRLHMLHDEEIVYKEVIVQGVTAIQAGETPHHIRQRLEAFLKERQREKKQEQKDRKKPARSKKK